MFQNYGITFIVILLLILGILLLLLFMLCICRGSWCQGKCRQVVEAAKKKLLYNPLIRYVYINGCKLNVTAALVFAQQGSPDADRTQLVVAVLVFSLVNLLPFLFAWILKKHASRLQEE